jgi:dipeptidyl aminopeptidase/acylaminoacyl peptidase
VPVTGGTTTWECLTKDNPAANSGPVFSSDGKLLAYRAQKKPGYEADKWNLLVVPTDPAGAFQDKPHNVSQDFAGSPDGPLWGGPAGRTLFFTADEKGESPVWEITLSDKLVPSLGKRREKHTNSLVSVSRDGMHLAFAQAAMDSPAEAFVLAVGSEGLRNLSQANRSLLAELDLPRPESVTVPGAGGTPMQMWILKPPGFDASKKYPLAYLVHGGPQSAWEDGWSFRWCPELWAAQGYVVALPNPRGSTGFGQKYVEEISGDWGGKCFQDLMAGVDYLEKQPYIDKERMAAAGASFGGYMMNWFQGHTTRFKTLICHCGVYNFDSMYATTDEIWFDEWEHGGPPWEKRASYEKYSPHRFAKNFKTPMLIIQNDLDFRCPVAEGFQMFDTLQRLGVPSRMINYPDEGHWVLKPANSQFWHREVFAWLTKYVAPGGK